MKQVWVPMMILAAACSTTPSTSKGKVGAANVSCPPNCCDDVPDCCTVAAKPEPSPAEATACCVDVAGCCATPSAGTL